MTQNLSHFVAGSDWLDELRLGRKRHAGATTSAEARKVCAVQEADDRIAEQFIEVALRQREVLQRRIDERRAEAEALRARADQLEREAAGDAIVLREIEDVLDLAPQLRVDLQTEELRGQRLRQVAIEILRAELGVGRPIHYRDWFRLVREAGHRVAGTNPLAAFLTVVSRAESVERVGTRSGLYQLRPV